MATLKTLLKNGQKALDREDYQVALMYFGQAVSLNPTSTDANNGMGWTLCNLNLWQDAVKPFKQVIRFEPDAERGYAGLGLAYIRLQLWVLAIDAFSNVIQINSGEASAFIQIGFAYGKLENWQKAIEFLKQAKSLEPCNADFRQMLAISYLMAGDEESAWDEYEALKEIDESLAEELLEMF